MTPQSTPRKRAVRLTADAHDALMRALEAQWQARGTDERFTREIKAELLGVSVTTVARIVGNRTVDRATLAIAFKKVGLAWDEEFCEHPPDEAEESSTESAPASEPHPIPESPRRWPLALTLAVALLAFAALGWKALAPRPESFPAWIAPYNALMEEGTQRYHRADYKGARVVFDKATALASQKDSAGRLAGSMQWSGMVAESEGRLEDARDGFQQSLDLRIKLDQIPQTASMQELLGDIETRLGLYAKAQEHLDDSLATYVVDANPVGVALVCRDLGSLAYRKGNLDDADLWFDRSLAAIKGLNQMAIEMDLCGRRALVLAARGRWTEAQKLQRQCLDHWKKDDHGRWVASCELQLGITETRLGHLVVAANLLSHSKAAYQRLGDADGLKRASQAIDRLETPSP